MAGLSAPRAWRFGVLGALLALLAGCAGKVGTVMTRDTVPPGEGDLIAFLIVPPADSPPADTLWISGDHPRLGAWSGRGLPAARRSDGSYRAAQRLSRGTAIEFKVTRGGWETVEKGPGGEEITNRRHVVTGPATLEVAVAAWRDVLERDRPSTLTGTIRRHPGLTSAFLARPHDVLVYLPPGYDDEPDRRYPVLYMHDGQNLFDQATAFVGVEWGIDETAERLIRAGEIEPLIVVGIANTADRVLEYTRVPSPPHGGGGADNYARFLVEELKPLMDAAYRTRPGREDTGVAGSSLGGLVSMYFAYRLEPFVSRIGVVSPAVWWANGDILEVVRSRPRPVSRVWLDIGSAEGEEAVRGAQALRDVLVERGWTLGTDLIYVEEASAPHNERAWARRTPDMLKFLFPPRR